MSEKKLYLLDAYALIYRSYFAFIRNPRYNSKGFNTSAVYGFVTTLLEVIESHKPTHIAVVFDPPGPTFRHNEYEPYKANRESMPEDIRQSLPYIKDIIDALNVTRVEVPGFEADDVVGTMARIAEEDGFEVFMMTPDKDYCQLVTSNAKLYKPKRSGKDAEIWGIQEVCENFMIDNPLQVIDVLGLMGDASDNIPGAPGIGEKTAKKLIAKYKSIENLYEKIDELSGKQKESLVEFREQVMLSKHLVTIDRFVPLEVTSDSLILKEADMGKIRPVFEELEFRTLLEKYNSSEETVQASVPVVQSGPIQGNLFDSNPGTLFQPESNLKSIDTEKPDYILVDTDDLLNELIQSMMENKPFCFDTETTGLDTITADLIGIAFCNQKKKAYFLPFPSNRKEALKLIKKIEPVFQTSGLKIGQNLKYDIQILKSYGLSVEEPLFDTMIAHYLVQPEYRHNLDYLAEKYLGYKTVSIEELIGKKGKGQRNMSTVPIDRLKDYACEDADITFQLMELLNAELESNGLKKLFEEIEMPLMPVLSDMELRGVSLNSEALIAYGKELTNDLISLEQSIYQDAGQEFNISSPKQLGIILFEKLKIDPGAKKTKTKQYSTGEEVLVQLKDKHPLVEKILDFRSLKKLLSTYIEALPRLVHPKTNKIHTSFNQTRVATGRLSSDNPNLQNIPIKEAKGREIRKAFIPDGKDQVFLSADYSQVELRLMAHMSGDENLIEAFINGEDIHTATAAKIFSVKPGDVTREMRNSAKTANFGIIYGISAFGLSQRLNIKRTDAKDIIDSYFNSYVKVKTYMDACIAEARQRGYVETIFGRRRYLNDINSRNATVRGLAERNAINAPIQGSAADVIKIAMIRIQKRIKQLNLKSSMLMQVHDELNFNVYNDELEQMKDIVVYEMENAVKLKVPLLVELGVGENWLEAH